jgi:hypothetical protein
LRSLAFAGPSQIFAALKRSTGVNPPNFVGRRSTVKILLHLSYLIGGTDDTHGHLLYANPSYGMFSASWPFLRRLGGGRCPGIWRRPSKLFAGHCRLRGCAGYRRVSCQIGIRRYQRSRQPNKDPGANPGRARLREELSYTTRPISWPGSKFRPIRSARGQI